MPLVSTHSQVRFEAVDFLQTYNQLEILPDCCPWQQKSAVSLTPCALEHSG